MFTRIYYQTFISHFDLYIWSSFAWFFPNQYLHTQ